MTIQSSQVRVDYVGNAAPAGCASSIPIAEPAAATGAASGVGEPSIARYRYTIYDAKVTSQSVDMTLRKARVESPDGSVAIDMDPNNCRSIADYLCGEFNRRIELAYVIDSDGRRMAWRWGFEGLLYWSREE